MSDINNPWKIEGKKEVYDNPWINVTEFDVINPGGGKGIYGKVHFKNAAIGVIALDDDRNTYLVGQHRFVLDAFSWEIPEGGCPEGEETYLEAAKRELLEEAGLIAEDWNVIVRSHLSNSVSDEYSIIFWPGN
ncbi:NUDIX domain-containing protein [Niabella ginsengisoli]|uniref:NUDIX hydrolase n=1 Tax=Niabella ginsengisoli TaxID=522298 RepID=A0ABS9SGU1_9BACT|nr:NUDIX hydrolase [Niabella ginsengisoli]MCH5597577.1 NUDIX hydrolase [Niabella ginsengisoli]